MRIGVDLDRDLLFRGDLKDPVEINRIRFARQQQATGRVTEDRHIRRFHRATDPVGHLLLGQVEARVNRRDDIVEAIEQLCVIVQPAIG